jgi:hypothetical protein
MGQAHGRYNYDAWESVSKAIEERMEKERNLVQEMKDYKPLQKFFSFVPVLINVEKNVTLLKEIEKAYKKECGMLSMARNIEMPEA